MSVSFHEEKSFVRPAQVREDDKLTMFLMRHSFGLITTRTHARLVQIVFILITFWITIAIFTKEDTYIEQLPPELINAPQPLNPL